MSLHDTYARLTPYELTFETLERATELAGVVRAEASGRGVDVGDPQSFITMADCNDT